VYHDNQVFAAVDTTGHKVLAVMPGRLWSVAAYASSSGYSQVASFISLIQGYIPWPMTYDADNNGYNSCKVSAGVWRVAYNASRFLPVMDGPGYNVLTIRGFLDCVLWHLVPAVME